MFTYQDCASTKTWRRHFALLLLLLRRPVVVVAVFGVALLPYRISTQPYIDPMFTTGAGGNGVFGMISENKSWTQSNANNNTLLYAYFFHRQRRRCEETGDVAGAGREIWRWHLRNVRGVFVALIRHDVNAYCERILIGWFLMNSKTFYDIWSQKTLYSWNAKKIIQNNHFMRMYAYKIPPWTGVVEPKFAPETISTEYDKIRP